MSDLLALQELHQSLLREINREARANPDSLYAGKFVGLANGRVVAVADTREEMVAQLEAIEPDPSKTACVEASHDYDEVIEIWGDL
jgi:hypothetical protein